MKDKVELEPQVINTRTLDGRVAARPDVTNDKYKKNHSSSRSHDLVAQ